MTLLEFINEPMLRAKEEQRALIQRLARTAGVKQSTLRAYSWGMRNPSPACAQILSIALGVTPGELFPNLYDNEGKRTDNEADGEADGTRKATPCD